MKDFKAAVIGTGGAAELHLLAYNKCPHTQVAAIVSRTPERAQAFAAQHNVRAYTSVEQMLAAERPDLVSVATLEWDHEQPVLQSLEAGAHVLCEKVMAHTIAAGERMAAAALRAGRTLGVNYNYRFVPAHQLLRQALDRGEFGPPALFTASMHSYLWPHMLDLLRFFFGDPVEVTGTLLDDQSHRPPVSSASNQPWVYQPDAPDAMLYHPSTAIAATFRYANPDFLATMSSSAHVPLEQHFWSYSLFARDQSLAIERATRNHLAGTASPGTAHTDGLCRFADTLRALPPATYPASFDQSIAAFVEAIRNNLPAPIPATEALAAMRLDAATVRSALTNQAVTFWRRPERYTPHPT